MGSDCIAVHMHASTSTIPNLSGHTSPILTAPLLPEQYTLENVRYWTYDKVRSMLGGCRDGQEPRGHQRRCLHQPRPMDPASRRLHPLT